MARSLILAPATPTRSRTPPVALNAATGWITDPAGVVEVFPLIPPLMPASSTPAGILSGAPVSQSPGPSSTLPPAPAPPRAALIAAVSVAPVMSPEGLSVVVDGIVPPCGPVSAGFAGRPGRAGAAH